MINEHQTSLSGFLRNRMLVVIGFIILIFLFLVSLVFILNSNKHEIALVNVFGKQRMLAKEMSGDANRKYSLLLLKDKEVSATERLEIQHLMQDIDNSIGKASGQFTTTLTSVHQGKIEIDGQNIDFSRAMIEIYPTFQKLDAVWREFSNFLEVVQNSESFDPKLDKVLDLLNTYDDRLVGYSDQITQTLVDIQQQDTRSNTIISISLLLAVSILLGITVYELQKYLAQPLNELYKGIYSMGLIKTKKRSSLTRRDITPVINEINEGLVKLNRMVELLSHISQDISFDETLEYIYQSFSAFIPYEHIGIALFKDDGKTLEASYGISDPQLGDLPQRMVGITSEISKTSLNGILSDGKPRIINDLESYTKNTNVQYNKVLLEAGIHSSITLPLKMNKEPLGMIFFSNTKRNVYTPEHGMFLMSLADSIAISFSKNIFIDELLYSNVLALAKMAEARDEDTGEHLDRMKEYARLIAELLTEEHVYEELMNIRFIKDIERYSPMHDIGKVAIRDGILLKPGKLTVEEFDEMKRHAVYGAEVLRTEESNINKKNRSLFAIGIEIAEGHHEKWNGQGYPFGRKGQEIPLSARIVAVADVFDALTSKRPYKKEFTFEESFRMIEEGRGQHFDPSIVDVFVKHRDRIYELYKSFRV